jgi:SAM-dependent methyltransferase
MLADEINKCDPKAVLDFGCGYNPFKGRIPNLVGIDPYNNCADYMVDILEFKVEPETFDHIIVFGSLNFNDRVDIEVRFEKLVSLLMPGGKMYFRANPGISWPNGPYVDIFPWSFEIAYELSQTHDLKLETFKKDANDRLYFVYVKNS